MSYNNKSKCGAFQTQFSPILEALAQAALVEISKLVDDGTAVLRLEMSQSQREIEALKRKLQLLERELRATQRVSEERGHPWSVEVPVWDKLRSTEKEGQHPPTAESVFGQEWSFRLRRPREPTAVEERTTPLQSSLTRNQVSSPVVFMKNQVRSPLVFMKNQVRSPVVLMRNQSAVMEEVRPESLPIKQERLEDDLCYSDPQPTSTGEEQVIQPTAAGGPEEQVAQCTPVEEGKKQETVPTPAGDPEELSEQHRCGHSDEELSGLEFVVKAEQEEEHVAQRPNQTACEHSTGRLNNLGSEYVMYERDSQLWTSFTQGDSDIETDDPGCSNATEQYSQSLSVHTELQHAPATVEGSGSTLSSFGSSYVEVFDKMSGKQPVYGEELRSEAIHTQQGQYRERSVDTVERENQTLLPQKQQHGPTVRQMRGGESRAQSHSGSQYEASSTLSAGVFRSDKGYGSKL
ncbi:hypothetical protein AAFF_G00218650 [Aldrovandia affinis]|uniref:Uncharacterized protein n=1 Tax=Aldrovandia affinis TaxID=143900 RepID=A0AAD7SXY1_9TELE|nr:hypothetical protein AAFF_G00218650 [Aldrovandia affinis]